MDHRPIQTAGDLVDAALTETAIVERLVGGGHVLDTGKRLAAHRSFLLLGKMIELPELKGGRIPFGRHFTLTMYPSWMVTVAYHLWGCG